MDAASVCILFSIKELAWGVGQSALSMNDARSKRVKKY
jgi:hypothetical protein